MHKLYAFLQPHLAKELPRKLPCFRPRPFLMFIPTTSLTLVRYKSQA